MNAMTPGLEEKTKNRDVEVAAGRADSNNAKPAGNGVMISSLRNIWVPKENERNFSYCTTVARQTAAILSSAVGIAIVASTVGK